MVEGKENAENKKIKNQKSKIKKKIKKEKRKKEFVSVVLDKMCIFCLYPIPDSQQRVKRGSYRHPILSRLLFVLIFVGPWDRLCQGLSLGLESISLCCLFILSNL